MGNRGFFLFGFYSLFKNVLFISSRSFIKDGRNLENPGKKHLTIRKRGSSHRCEKPNGLESTLLSTRLQGPAGGSGE